MAFRKSLFLQHAAFYLVLDYLAQLQSMCNIAQQWNVKRICLLFAVKRWVEKKLLQLGWLPVNIKEDSLACWEMELFSPSSYYRICVDKVNSHFRSGPPSWWASHRWQHNCFTMMIDLRWPTWIKVLWWKQVGSVHQSVFWEQ